MDDVLDDRITIRVSREQHRRLRKIARATGQSPGVVIRAFLDADERRQAETSRIRTQRRKRLDDAYVEIERAAAEVQEAVRSGDDDAAAVAAAQLDAASRESRRRQDELDTLDEAIANGWLAADREDPDARDHVARIHELDIQAWMGHADSKTTRIYMHYAPSADEAARIGAAFAAEDARGNSGGSKVSASDVIRAA